MALVVEDGTGLANAESFNSVDAITAYNAAHANDPAWAALSSDTERERCARLAAQFMVARWGQRLQGCRLRDAQALPLPRESICVDDVELPAAPLPRGWLDAHCELSVRAASGPLMPDQAAPGDIELERVKVGSIEVETRFGNGGRSQSTWLPLVDALVAPLLRPANEVVRG